MPFWPLQVYKVEEYLRSLYIEYWHRQYSQFSLLINALMMSVLHFAVKTSRQ